MERERKKKKRHEIKSSAPLGKLESKPPKASESTHSGEKCAQVPLNRRHDNAALPPNQTNKPQKEREISERNPRPPLPPPPHKMTPIKKKKMNK